ncbi:hypothetical protein C1N66_30900 (plasmid) [Bacillus cereus]|uniref:Non-canonical purine NTP pyrophosphatase n=1 Tax=Bacillus cereus TaxID=1396 RepID=A0AB73US75_BACCE|nr:non-canonical purine NTP pyrophosphatase [Bacillus cereus]HDR3523477.1 hypothetical protein [Bacillus pacificus]QHV07970.1 hypothetical protein C1N82_32760 [Bacillus cereus]QHV47430.1 hypothetical protein C1N66_30900 [Bacillus cereus]HDR3634034.1 hypothetical protein [Bacillus pacificus]HDR7652970.1 hypothetical protein [Bacillus pacificus]
MNKLGLVTTNIGKYEEFKRTIKKIEGLELILLNDIKNIEEGDSIEQNAQIKSLAGSKEVSFPVIATDEGMFLDFLPTSEQPGAYIRRIVGAQATDEEIIEHYSNLIRDNKTGAGKIVTCYAISLNSKIINQEINVQECLFKIPASNIRIPGRPLASLHYFEEYGGFYSDLSAEEKQSVNQNFSEKIVKFILNTLKML